jgi:hypothetical protein
VTFPRPRERKAVLEHPDYYKLREYLIEFLEVRAYKNSPSKPQPPAVKPSLPPSDQILMPATRT